LKSVETLPTAEDVRAKALEDAAKVADAEAERQIDDYGASSTAERIAAAILVLGSKT
jgi:hypothetical protein